MTTIDHTTANTDHEAQELYEHDCYISDRRGALLSELGDTLAAMQRVQTILTELCSNAVYDVELAEGPDDLASYLRDSLRNTRAAYTIVHAIIAAETV
jgi:hypothetical protein